MGKNWIVINCNEFERARHKRMKWDGYEGCTPLFKDFFPRTAQHPTPNIPSPHPTPPHRTGPPSERSKTIYTTYDRVEKSRHWNIVKVDLFIYLFSHGKNTVLNIPNARDYIRKSQSRCFIQHPLLCNGRDT